MIVARASPPSPTPAPTLVGAATGVFPLQPRQTNYGYGSGCLNVYDGLQCTTILNGCYSDFLAATDYNSAATSCYCNYGISYLDCFFSQVATGSCASYYGVTDWGQYQMSFYTEYCGSIPPSAMAHIQPPTSVSLDFDTVDIVTATGALQQPNYAGQPNYKGTGQLLGGDCAETDFTLVDAGSTVFYAGFQGCNKNRPECCPWPVATATTSASGAAATDAQDNLAYDFPQPSNKDMAQLASCAEDYYSISGGCCPNGFWPFTAEVGGITPCWSSIDRVEAPTLTVEKDAKTMDKPTSAVVNIVWSMRYSVADPGGGGLSTAAKAGIGAGAGVAAILIAGLAICLWRYRRKNKVLAASQPQAAVPVQGLPPHQQQQQLLQQQAPFQQQPMMQQHLAPSPNGQYPHGMSFQPGMAAAVPPPASDRASMATSATPVSPAALVPQHTGTSNGGVSELSSQSGQNLLHNAQPHGGYANPRASHATSSGAGSPAASAGGGGPASGNNGGAQGVAYPAPIAEADEGAGQYPPPPQYGYNYYHPQQQQQQQQHDYQYPPQQQHQQQQPPQQWQQQYSAAGAYPGPGGHGHGHDQAQGGYGGYGFPANVSEMSATREPQEVPGSHQMQQDAERR